MNKQTSKTCVETVRTHLRPMSHSKWLFKYAQGQQTHAWKHTRMIAYGYMHAHIANGHEHAYACASNTYMYTWLCTHLCARTFHTWEHAHAWTYVWAPIHMHTRTCVHTYTRACVFICFFIHDFYSQTFKKQIKYVGIFTVSYLDTFTSSFF